MVLKRSTEHKKGSIEEYYESCLTPFAWNLVCGEIEAAKNMEFCFEATASPETCGCNKTPSGDTHPKQLTRPITFPIAFTTTLPIMATTVLVSQQIWLQCQTLPYFKLACDNLYR
ncbi:hypothetical protein M8J76_009090 [Diaphorina citri]|nr:hypothetical protein M8J76_009090 [Diaphorina citri]KAI5738255.1 hypothetical protein M8J77_004665 [Diaphorina citri]